VAFLGIDIGSTITRAALIDEDLHMLALANAPTNIDGSLQAAIDDVRAVSRKALDQVGFRIGAIDAVGISCSGTADDADGCVLSPILQWNEPVPVRTIAHSYVSAPVFVTNDAQAAAVGEAHYGAGMPYDRFSLIRMGSFIEIAMVMGAKPVETDALPASVATEVEFLHEARGLVDPDEGRDGGLSGIRLNRISSSQIMEGARRKHPIALHATDWLAERMTEGVVSATTEHAPQAIIISGAMQRDQQYLGRLVTRKLAQTRSAIAGIPVESALLGNDAKAFGAAIIALQRA